MTYSLLDTDTLTAFLHGKEGLIERVVAALQRAKTDAQLAHAYQNLTAAVRALSGLHIATFSEAAIALEENAVVITRNLRDFGRVPSLPCENWED